MGMPPHPQDQFFAQRETRHCPHFREPHPRLVRRVAARNERKSPQEGQESVTGPSSAGEGGGGGGSVGGRGQVGRGPSQRGEARILIAAGPITTAAPAAISLKEGSATPRERKRAKSTWCRRGSGTTKCPAIAGERCRTPMSLSRKALAVDGRSRGLSDGSEQCMKTNRQARRNLLRCFQRGGIGRGWAESGGGGNTSIQ